MGAKRVKRHLTKEQFERACARFNIREDLKLAAYRVMVDPRESMPKIESDTGVHRQSIQQVVAKVWQHHQELNELPEGWVAITVNFPVERAAEVQQESNDLFGAYCAETESH